MHDVAAAGSGDTGPAAREAENAGSGASGVCLPRHQRHGDTPASSRQSRELYGALDLGTNNCRLLIARRQPGGAREFQVIDAFSRIVRLGEGLAQSGRLSEDAMERTIDALSVCAEKLARRGVARVRSVATEACRQAANSAEFVRRAYLETGLALDVISPAEEARLAVLGCQTLFDDRARHTLVFDIGGGSTEAALVERADGDEGTFTHRIALWISIPWGVVSLAETEAEDAGCRIERMQAYARMKARIATHLRPLAPAMHGEVHLLGTSGTITTLASLHMGLPQYDRQQVDGSLAPAGGLVALCHALAEKSAGERAAVPGIGADRARLIVAGAAILEALVDLGVAPDIRVADRGLREGILRSLIQRVGCAASQRPA